MVKWWDYEKERTSILTALRNIHIHWRRVMRGATGETDMHYQRPTLRSAPRLPSTNLLKKCETKKKKKNIKLLSNPWTQAAKHLPGWQHRPSRRGRGTAAGQRGNTRPWWRTSPSWFWRRRDGERDGYKQMPRPLSLNPPSLCLWVFLPLPLPQLLLVIV